MWPDYVKFDAEAARKQVKLITVCFAEMHGCRDLAKKLEEGQTSLVWTEDGKAIELTAVLKAKYRNAAIWLEDLNAQLIAAREKLREQIAETNEIDEQQKADYDHQLGKLLGSTPLKYPKAI